MLNNVEVSAEYIIKLKKEMESESARIFQGNDPKLKSCYDDLQEASNNFKRVLQVIFFLLYFIFIFYFYILFYFISIFLLLLLLFLFYYCFLINLLLFII